MSDERNQDNMTPEDLRALDAVGHMEYPKAPEDVRRRARKAFLTGDAPAPVRLHRSDFSLVRRLAVPVLAAAAAITLFVHGRTPSSGWIVTDVVERTGVDLEVGCGAPGEEVFAGRVETGPASEFEIQLGRDLRLRMMPGTSIELPGGPGRWFDRDRTLTVLSGEVYGTSAEGGLGYRFRIQTPEAVGELTGTTFAAFRTPEGTCFCLLEGSLRVTPMTRRDAVDVVVGQRLFVYRDGRPLRMEPMSDMERTKLSMMDDSGIVTPPPFPH